METSGRNEKHIAMYIGSLTKGGAERVMVNLAEFFYEQGYKVTFVTTYLSENEYEVKHAAWKRVPAGAPGGVLVMDTDENPAWVDPMGGEKDGIDRVFSALLKDEQKGRAYNLQMRHKKLRNIWKELHPDLILSFIGKNNIMAISTAAGLGIPVVVSVRSNPDREYASLSMRTSMYATFGKAAGIVVQSKGAKERLPKFLQDKCMILQNSLNPSFIRPRYLGEREKKIVMVARLDENKNQAMVMEAFKDVRERGFKDYTLALYGDGPDRMKLQHLAVKLGIEKNVEFKGNVQHVAEHIEKASMFILASNQEGMPNSLIEALSLGLPCISTDCPCGGPRELINSGENGLLVPVGDKKKMTDAMLRILSDKDLSDRFSIEAVKIQGKCSPDVINGKWKEYFDNIIGR
ncbi:MAG: glycosyltransferase [Butyrivibrio sp.]|nr:glycosyltransferase [Butyrivibrio sp.]